MFAAQMSDIQEWLQRGSEKGATHMIVAVDGFDHEDYPVYVMPGENANEIAEKYRQMEMQRVKEVYDISLDHQAQLDQRRAFNL
jgi:hypothetical protein